MKINVNKLLRKLTQYSDGKLELSSGQVRAIELLLKKSMPDLKSEETISEIDNQITITIKRQA